MLHRILVLTLLTTTLCSFEIITETNTEYEKFQRLKQDVLRASKVGHEYVYDLTGIDECNKSRLKYLGTVRTSRGNQYKLLTSFHVFRTSNKNCHGASAIEIYSLKNKFIGEYHVGMRVDLPDELLNKRLIYLTNSEDCNLRKDQSIDLSHGLPKSFFIRCSKNGGDIYYFSSGD